MSHDDVSTDGDQAVEPGPSRRRFLAGAGAVAAVAGFAAGCSDDDATAVTDAASTKSATTASAAVEEPVAESQRFPFAGPRQLAVARNHASAGLIASFDVITVDRSELAGAMQQLSDEIERLMGGTASQSEDEFVPPVDSGAIGAEGSTVGTAITVAVGASLFDDRFGLAEQRPRELIAMPRFFNDRLVRPELSHGDILLTITADTPQAAAFALHQAVSVTERRLRVRWVQEGHNTLLPEAPGQIAPTRNLLGFRDGTSNLDPADDDVMAQHVWVDEGDDEPAWAVGGTYQATRIIRMLIEFWATAALVRQEQIFGRHRDTGAPLGQDQEGEEPTFASDPSDETVPRRSHMRLANPRTPDAARILRQGFSYLNGADQNGTLDQGLLFLCYQRSLRRGFLEVQSRLDGEPLEDYVKPVGGGLFFVLPGPGDDGGWLGQSMFEL